MENVRSIIQYQTKIWLQDIQVLVACWYDFILKVNPLSLNIYEKNKWGKLVNAILCLGPLLAPLA